MCSLKSQNYKFVILKNEFLYVNKYKVNANVEEVRRTRNEKGFFTAFFISLRKRGYSQNVDIIC